MRGTGLDGGGSALEGNPGLQVQGGKETAVVQERNQSNMEN